MTLDLFIPVFKSLAPLDRCLSSINETKEPFRGLKIWVVVNGESAGPYQDLLRKFGNLEVKILHLKEKSRAMARNCAKTHGLSENILFVDADVQLDLKKVLELLNYQQKYELDVVQGTVEPISKETQLQEQRLKQYLALQSSSFKTLNTSCLLVRRKVLEFISFDSNFIRCEDTDFFFQLMSHDFCIGFPDCIVGHVTWDQSSFDYYVKRSFAQGYYSKKLKLKYPFIQDKFFMSNNFFWRLGYLYPNRTPIKLVLNKARAEYAFMGNNWRFLPSTFFYFHKDVGVVLNFTNESRLLFPARKLREILSVGFEGFEEITQLKKMGYIEFK